MFHFFVSELSMGRSGQQYAFKIFSRSQSLPLEVACETDADMKDWMEKIAQCSTSAVQRVSLTLCVLFQELTFSYP